MATYRITLSKEGTGVWTQSKTYRVSTEVYNALDTLISKTHKPLNGD
jgi:hypothetical protein